MKLLCLIRHDWKPRVRVFDPPKLREIEVPHSVPLGPVYMVPTGRYREHHWEYTGRKCRRCGKATP